MANVGVKTEKHFYFLGLITVGVILITSYAALSGHTSIIDTNYATIDESFLQNLQKIINSSILNRQVQPQDTVVDLYDKVRVLCWIMTSPSNRETKAIHVKATWGKRCNKLLFMSTENDTTLPSIDLKVQEGRDYLWAKTKKAFKYVYKHHQKEYDWVLKADDDTYVIVENLRYLLSIYDPAFPIYFGSNFKLFSKQGYMSGGGGYVLSKEAVRVFVEEALPNPAKCKQSPHGAEDAEMGKCLNNTGVLAGDSRDPDGRGRFFPFNPHDHLKKGHIGRGHWYWDYIKYPIENGLNCCSGTAISFHYITPSQMYELDYLLYKLRPFNQPANVPYPAELPPDKSVVPKQLLEESRRKRRRRK